MGGVTPDRRGPKRKVMTLLRPRKGHALLPMLFPDAISGKQKDALKCLSC
jgi:hypothetical protein